MSEPVREYWLFQYKEGVHVERAFESSAPGEVVPWKVTRYMNRIKPGDVIFYWRAGASAGLKGWGSVAGAPEESPGETFLRVPVRTEVNLGEVVPKAEVRDVPEISDLAVITQGRQGTNFPVSMKQAVGLARLIGARGQPSPTVSVQELAESSRRRIDRELARLNDGATVLDEAAAEDAAALAAAVRMALGEPTGERFTAALHATARFALRELPPHASTLAAVARDLYGELSALARLEGGLSEAEAPGSPEALVSGASPDAKAAEAGALPEDGPDDPLIWPWEERDRVGIGEAVHNLARYIAHEDLVPPRAIGVFGDWGSGKTFFMKALQSQIALLAWSSDRAKRNGTGSVFCGRVVQIEFNAWHYVESNLWASLAGHIFEELHEALAGREAGSATGVDDLFRTLQTFREAVAETDRIAARVAELEETLPALRDREESARADVARQAAALAGAVADRLAALVSEGKGLDKREQKRLRELLHLDRLEELAAGRAELERLARDGRGLLGRMGLYVRSWTPANYALAFLAVALAAFAVPMAAAVARLDLDVLEWLTGVIGSYVTLATGALAWVAQRGRRVLGIVDSAVGLVADADARAREATGPALLAAEEELADARRELAEAEERLRVRRDELDGIQTRIRQENVGVQLRAFLEDRVRNQAYARHLGLISLVRKDFERLSELMSNFWSKRNEEGAHAVLVEYDENGEPREVTVPFIERIILYIDDLDRCPADKVIEVLQAVHLLLGFKLFVVVVGVDVRWVGRSLVEAYPALLEGGVGAPRPGRAARSASSDDYLEKIFQIPFRIPPMDPEAQEQLVNGLLEERFLPGWTRDDDATTPLLDLLPTELYLYPDESGAIVELHSCLGRSPRRVKRFVDVYRLMRAGMNEGDVESLVRTGQYRAILAVFALLNGAAAFGPGVLEGLHRTLVEDPTAVLVNGFGPWFDLAFGQEARADAWERRAARAVMDFLDRAAPNPPERDALRDALLTWMPEAARYSFREVRLTHA